MYTYEPVCTHGSLSFPTGWGTYVIWKQSPAALTQLLKDTQEQATPGTDSRVISLHKENAGQ